MADAVERAERGHRAIWPLFAAGFVTAFGSHGVAANLAAASPDDLAQQVLALGILLALYDGAEVALKPVFGMLADRVGLRPVLLGGLAAFALASVVFVLAADPAALGVARFAQGAAASAFSPAAGALIARLAPDRRRGKAFGSYGAWKSLGYTAGPLLGGYPWLFGLLAALALLVLAWAALAVPSPPPLPRQRQSMADLVRRVTDRGFLPPTTALAVSAAALSCGVGFLPLVGVRDGLSPVITGASVSVLAITASLSQPLVGRLRDRGRLPDRAGLIAGTLVTAVGLAQRVPGVPAGEVGLGRGDVGGAEHRRDALHGAGRDHDRRPGGGAQGGAAVRAVGAVGMSAGARRHRPRRLDLGGHLLLCPRRVHPPQGAAP